MTKKDLLAIVIFLLAAVCFQPRRIDAKSLVDPDPLLDEALGYAAVYNYEKAQHICDRILSITEDPAIQARAHWIKAVAFAKFQLEYRTNELSEKLEREKGYIRKLDPSLLRERLYHFEVVQRFHKTVESDVEGILKQAVSEFEKEQIPEADRHYKIGQSFLAAASIAGEKAKEYYRQSADHMSKAHKLAPENYEYAAYCLTALARADRLTEAVEVGKELTKKYKAAPRFSMESDPWYLYAAAVGLTDIMEARRIALERSGSPDADAGIFFYVTQSDVRAAKTPEEKAGIWREFIRKMENGQIPRKGYNLRFLVSAYYKLGHFESRAKRPEKSLEAYRKLSEYSPHYAGIHYNQGVVLEMLSGKETDPEKKTSLMEQSRKQFELQKKYNWHGTMKQSADARRLK